MNFKEESIGKTEVMSSQYGRRNFKKSIFQLNELFRAASRLRAEGHSFSDPGEMNFFDFLILF